MRSSKLIDEGKLIMMMPCPECDAKGGWFVGPVHARDWKGCPKCLGTLEVLDNEHPEPAPVVVMPKAKKEVVVEPVAEEK